MSLGDFGIGVGETGRLEMRGWGFPEKLDGGGWLGARLGSFSLWPTHFLGTNYIYLLN